MPGARSSTPPVARPRCCPCGELPGPGASSLTRRDFLKGAGLTALGSVAPTGLTWPLQAVRAQDSGTTVRIAPTRNASSLLGKALAEKNLEAIRKGYQEGDRT